MSDSTGRPQTRRRKSLSEKQLAILEVIQRSIARHGYPPSMREIGDAVGLKSLSSVTHQLNQLELSGYLRRDAGKTRAMEVLIDLPGTATENPADSGPAVGDAAMVPLVGRIAAGGLAHESVLLSPLWRALVFECRRPVVGCRYRNRIRFADDFIAGGPRVAFDGSAPGSAVDSIQYRR